LVEKCPAAFLGHGALQTHTLALQLRFSFEMSASRMSLVSASPERPCDDVGGLDAALCEFHSDAADFLDRPADQE